MQQAAVQQLVKLNPDKVLVFNVDRTLNSSTTRLTVENITDGYVAFKVKTTAPKSYLVRPSSGVIPANESQDVQIILQPLTNVSPGQSLDRFLIQSCQVQSNTPLQREEWQEMDKSKIVDQRLAVTMDFVGNPPSQSFDPSSVAAAGIPTNYNELRAKYEELLGFCVATEKQKRELELEVESMRSKGIPTGGIAGLHGKTGFPLWQVVLFVVGSVAVLKLIKFL